MVKDRDTVISEFNNLVNMNPDELREWLEEEDSQSSGWAGESGETIGHSRYLRGRRIVDILEENPRREPSGYSDADLEHMRKVVSYCKRHLAQEATAKQDTRSKSYRSLKNWGHDALKE
ncbi:uncharacterized protein N7459_005619 [Penicillium hispanicum]|uniref:uncharacterized protein n=1 Tax=Penicillium hispanicum TaxID=1080232 RepID=UPI002541BAF0|nr:uncharacterized protein N7459_005619 [Penicillium hispanicum]KAJ5579634.1 hypothetical protein N7459_005619 [Penicillium hispanicum]